MKLKKLKQILDFPELLSPPKVGDVVRGKIIKKGSLSIYVDLGNFKTGIIYGREYLKAKEMLRDLKEGDEIFAKIIEIENEEGYVELSVQEAQEELIWKELLEKKEKGEKIKVKIVGANKGGLVTKISGLSAFIPISQLSPEHSPQIENPQPAKIVKELQKFVNQEFEVRIINLNPKTKSIVLSEKD